MTTVVRAAEFVPPKSFTVDLTTSNYEDEINYQLSSPLSSYTQVPGTDKVVLEHTKYYPERLKSTKQKLNELRSEMDALRQEFEQKRREDQRTFQQKIEETNEKFVETNRKLERLEAEREAKDKLLLNWETKSRLVQALNDRHVFENNIIPQNLYDSLKIEGCNYLPYLLSVCAVYYKEEVVTCLKIGRKEQDKYETKAARLIKKGLEDGLDSIWHSIPELDRDLMIKLWLTRPDIRTSMGHPTPTVEEGMNVIRADSQLSEVERHFINDLLPIAVDKAQHPLFTAG